MKKTIFKFLMLFGMLFFTYGIQAQNTVRGTVNDPAENEGLIGANIIIKGTSIGTTTDIDGNFTLTSSETLPWTLEISYTGYGTKEVVVSSNNSNITVELAEGVIFGDDIVISASRKREKVQEAPASISVISARKLETSANATDAVRNLTNVAGVQIQQQSANSINISMRGSAGLFGTDVFPIMDYRSLVGPGIGTFQSSQAGISNIDLQRIEVVRGPGSALYGPGVTQGVVHFITKSPIDEPGTTVELMGGELETFGGTLRHATKVSDKFGFKINAQYKQGKEFTLDPNDPGDAIQIARFLPNGGVFTPGVSESGFVDATLPPTQIFSFADLDEDGDGNPMSDSWDNSAINATLEFRPKDNLNVTLAGGFNGSHAVFYNEQGEGFAAGKEFWGQARMQAGGLFAQLFVVDNNGGGEDDPTFLYQTGNNTSLARTQVEGQLQYNFGIESFLNSDWTAGFDYRLAQQRTSNLVYGRNEDDDDYNVVGGYLQGKFALSPKLDLVAAGRYDKFNFIDEGAFAPRVALVYKANPKHTFRASYNKTNSTVSNLQLNIDFPLSTIVPGQFDVWLYGNKTTQTFGANPDISWAIPGLIPDVPQGTPGLPLGVPFALVNTQTVAGIEAFLLNDPTTAPLAPVIAGILTNLDPSTLGTTGSLSPGFNIFDGTPLTPIDAPISTLSTSDNFEIGYKGLINNKLGVSLDFYSVTQKKNSQFTAISPAYVLSGYDALPTDLGNNVFGQASPQIIAALTPLLGAAGAEATAAALAPLIVGGYTQAGDAALNTPNPAFGGISLNQLLTALPFHAVNQTNEPPQNGATHLAAGYRTFDERTFYGADLGLDYYFTDDISGFFNYSWVSDNQFMQRVIGNEAAGELPSYLNIPKNKFRVGVNYAPAEGLRGSLSFQHDDAYVASAGQFSTDDLSTPNVVEKTDPRNLLDAAVGYKFSNGLAIDITATNALNKQYRYLPNMPKIGRRVLGKLVYTFGGKNKLNSDGMTGSLDSDGDGIKDSKDRCPDIAGIRKYKGCPMSEEDMAAKAAADAKLAAEAAAKAEAEAKARAEEQARIAAEAAAKAEADARARAEEEARLAAEAAAKAEAEAAAKAEAEAKARATAASTATRDAEVSRVFSGALNGIQFKTGQNAFTSSSYNVMAQVVSVMNQYPNMDVTIEGHTDSVGSREPNRKLSQRRADAVKSYLVSKGISASRLKAIGYGEARPIADNMNKEGRAKNRRVAFVPTYR